VSKLFDGSDDDLTYGQALVELAKVGLFRTEQHRDEVVRAIQVEHDLVPPEPDVIANLSDPRDITLRNQDAEIAALKAELERRNQAAEREAANAAQIAELRGQLAPAPATPETRSEAIAPRDAELASRGE
jgi:hypothetical protein